MYPMSLRSKLRAFSVVNLSFLMVLLLTASLVACGPGSPEEQVIQTRGQYSVQLNTWFPKAPEEPELEPLAEGEAAEGEAAEGEAAEGEAADVEAAEGEAAEGEAAEGEAVEGEAAEGEAAEAAPTTIVFDVIVLFSGSDPLPGITVDFTQADADGNEKAAWREFLDIPSIVKAETKQIMVEAEVDFVEGDQFSVQLLKYVDPANYGDYKEFAAAAAGN